MHYLLSIGISLYKGARRAAQQTFKVLVLEKSLARARGCLSCSHRLLLILEWEGDYYYYYYYYYCIHLDGEGDGDGLVERGVRLQQGSLTQTLDLELLSDLEEGLEAVLGDVDLAEVDEVHQRGQVIGPHIRE